MCTITSLPDDCLTQILCATPSFGKMASVNKQFYLNCQLAAQQIFANLPTDPLINFESAKTYKKFPGTLTDKKIALKALPFFLSNISNHFKNTALYTEGKLSVALQETFFSSTASDLLARLEKEEEDQALYTIFKNSNKDAWRACIDDDITISIQNIRDFLKTPQNDMYLTFQNVTSIPNALIAAYPVLTFINVFSSKLDSLPDSLMSHPSLSQLEIHNCELGNNTFKTNASSSIKMLDIDGSKFESLPDWISQLSKLEQLNIPHNNIKEISEDFDWSHLTSLVDLDLGDNPLKTLPKGIGQLLNLNYLIFDKGISKNMASLPDEILFSANTYISEDFDILQFHWKGFYSIFTPLHFGFKTAKEIISNLSLSMKVLVVSLEIILSPLLALSLIAFGLYLCFAIQYVKIKNYFYY